MYSKYVTVVLDSRLNRPLDYGVPDEWLEKVQIGSRVIVPLRGSPLPATVLHVRNRSQIKKVQPLHKVIFEEQMLPDDLMQLAEWISRYYATPLAKVMKTMMPASVRKETKKREQLFIKRIWSVEKIREHVQTIRSSAQAKVLDVLLLHPKGVLLSQLLEEAGVSASPVQSLVEKKILTQDKVHIDRSELFDEEFFPTRPKKLNPEQQQTLDALKEGTHLIHGVTGSGKTEIYLQAIQQQLDAGKSVILLVPEIALTSQTIERLKSRFTERLAILHHRLSDGERFDAWHAIRKGDVRIVVGARSAIFSPVQKLGMVIVDEEQEGSFKQCDEMPCYNARDIAVVRAKMNGAIAVLGSATPALESYHNALIGKYQLHNLTKRATKANLPKVHVIDMKHERENFGNYSLFSAGLIDKLKLRLEKGEQSLLFLNRRGYYTCQKCKACGEAVKCNHCDVAMTFHKGQNILSCHLCGFSHSPPPAQCPSCQSYNAESFKGPGTEQVERMLHALFPEVRTLRMDGDTTRHKGSHDKLFKQFRSGKADILIGTQMIAKGLHFPSVTLVGILNMDGALQIPDFRSSESSFQLIAQVAGRAGRGSLPGEVIIQTSLAHHPIIAHASTEDYASFYKEEVESRKFFNYPPFSHLAKLTFSGKDEDKTEQFAKSVHQRLVQTLPPTFTLNPIVPCGYAKIKDRYRFQCLIQSTQIHTLHHYLKVEVPSSLRMLIDIDPLSTFS